MRIYSSKRLVTNGIFKITCRTTFHDFQRLNVANNDGTLREASSWAMLSRVNPLAEMQTADANRPEVLSGSEAFYRTALESLSEGVMILDSDCGSFMPIAWCMKSQ